ncbi:MAG TPA: hypothetical protein VNN22_16785, partial [Verrucomicrobiae bacterium]|nr:hypothetical protein [Verrucomicrobiae bacterium]
MIVKQNGHTSFSHHAGKSRDGLIVDAHQTKELDAEILVKLGQAAGRHREGDGLIVKPWTAGWECDGPLNHIEIRIGPANDSNGLWRWHGIIRARLQREIYILLLGSVRVTFQLIIDAIMERFPGTIGSEALHKDRHLLPGAVGGIVNVRRNPVVGLLK